ncbi:unnamed protein product [Effrenium voratum]|nr:unnamed protein product [Effrenium voratum]
MLVSESSSGSSSCTPVASGPPPSEPAWAGKVSAQPAPSQGPATLASMPPTPPVPVPQAAQAPAPHAVSQTHVHVPMWGGGSPTLPYRPVSNPAAGVLYTLHQAFCSAPSAPSSARLRVAMRGGGESVPTGLVWPSPEAEEKLREVDGIKLYPTHAWKDDMEPILDSKKKLEDTPVIVGVAADSGCGKSTFLRRILGALGTEVEPGHTAIGDMMTVICLDDYHTNDRAGRKATGLTALDARENDFDLMGVQIEALKKGKAVYKPIYNHDTGNKDPPELIEPNKVMVFEGLHPIYDEKARTQLDLAIYIDIVNDVKFAWKVQRDVEERGWTEEQVREDIEKRLPDFSKYVDPQKANADVVLRYEPSDQGLPYLKVKLIQKKGGNFPMVTLKKDLELKGSKPGATLKMYDDDWFGNAVTVVEMDGEIDMDNMEEQLKEIESNMEGLGAKKDGEFTEGLAAKALQQAQEQPRHGQGAGAAPPEHAPRLRHCASAAGMSFRALAKDRVKILRYPTCLRAAPGAHGRRYGLGAAPLRLGTLKDLSHRPPEPKGVMRTGGPIGNDRGPRVETRLAAGVLYTLQQVYAIETATRRAMDSQAFVSPAASSRQLRAVALRAVGGLMSWSPVQFVFQLVSLLRGLSHGQFRLGSDEKQRRRVTSPMAMAGLCSDGRGIILVTCLGAYFLSMAMIYQMSPFFEVYARESCGASTVTVGFIFAAMPAASFLGNLAMDGLIRRFGVEVMMNFGLILLAVSSLGFGLSKDTPVIVGVAADSGCGKSTFLRRILGALGTEVQPGHTAIGDMMTVICLDDYHTNDRAGRKATGLTALDARENDFDLMGVQIEALKKGKAVYKPIYNHDTGNKDPPELIEPNKVMVFEGLHPIYDEKARSQLDLAIYIDIVNDVKFAWKVQRDVEERGWTEDQVREDIEKRLPDFSKYVDPQKANADVVLRYEPSDQGLPYLKVKLIQKKARATKR